MYDIPKNEDQCRSKLREMFAKHTDVKDIRVIDLLVIKVCNPFFYYVLMTIISYIKN